MGGLSLAAVGRPPRPSSTLLVMPSVPRAAHRPGGRTLRRGAHRNGHLGLPSSVFSGQRPWKLSLGTSQPSLSSQIHALRVTPSVSQGSVFGDRSLKGW